MSMHTQIEDFHAPESLEEAFALLQDTSKRAIAVAGATEVGLRVRNDVRALVDLSRLGLDGIRVDDAIANEPIRNLTSLGGNVVHLTSWSDTPPALLALGAKFRVQGTGFDQWYDADTMFERPPRKLLGTTKLITEVLIPPRLPHTGSHFIKYSKTAVDFALVNAAAEVTLHGDTVASARIAVGAIHTPPIRVTDAEAVVIGTTGDSDMLNAAAEATATQVTPRRDMRATDSYLQHSAGVVVRRCLAGAIARAREDMG